MKTVFIAAGFVIGIVVVRYFLLDTFEVMGWKSFWKALLNGHIKFSYLDDVLSSSTFAKSAIGGVVGALAGLGLSKVLK